jgi:osmotically-inducible protein OsmY
MERNSENKNRYGNDRNRRRNDQFNDRYQSSDYQENRRQDWEQDENQWDQGLRDERSNRRGNYGSYSAGRNDRRLESMGSLGNDWANRSETNDYTSDRDFGRRDYGRRNFGNYGDQNRFSDTGNQGSFRDDERDRDRLSSNRGDNSRNWWDKTRDEVSGWFGDENAQQRRDRDQQGEHRGKGPKGYARTDERIKEDVNERLTDESMVDASEIEVDVRNGEVFLKGTVNSRQEKRRAEDIVESISGVKNVENHIKVQQAGFKSGNSGQSSGQFDEKRFEKDPSSGMKTAPTAEYNKNN